MTATTATNLWQRTLLVLGSLALIVASLYLAKPLLIPIVVAILFTFILSPVVAALQNRGLGRVPASLLVVLGAVAILAGLCWGFTAQMHTLLQELPQHKHTIMARVDALHDSEPGPATALIQMIKDITAQLQKSDGSLETTSSAEPVPVVIQEPTPAASLKWLQPIVGPTLEVVANLALILVLVLFMLIQRENLRNRLISVISRRQLTHTTRAIDDAAQRISRFLLLQTLVNIGFGLTLGLGLLALGMPYAVLWGLLGMVLRFIPFLGTWLLASLLVLFSIALFPGWTMPLMVMGLFLSLELLAYYGVEPLLFGHGTGVSAIALLLAAVFWAWLWGPVGLILSTPMTVVFMVLGKHVPDLAVLGVLLADEPGLSIWETYYQRLLAHDDDEATDLLEDYLQKHTAAELVQDVLVPALVQTKRDLRRDEITLEMGAQIVASTKESLAELVGTASPSDMPVGQEARVAVLACPAADEADELVLDEFERVLPPRDGVLDMMSSKALVAEVLSQVEEHGVSAVLIVGVAPGGLTRMRYLCKRLRGAYPNLTIVAGYWGSTEREESLRRRLKEAGANHIGLTFAETQQQIMPYLSVTKAGTSKPAGQPAPVGV